MKKEKVIEEIVDSINFVIDKADSHCENLKLDIFDQNALFSVDVKSLQVWNRFFKFVKKLFLLEEEVERIVVDQDEKNKLKELPICKVLSNKQSSVVGFLTLYGSDVSMMLIDFNDRLRRAISSFQNSESEMIIKGDKNGKRF